MKKIMLLGLSVFGMTNFANAWMAYYPQDWTPSGNGNSIVTCYSQNEDPCMYGGGDGPQVGQTVAILSIDGITSWGTIMSCVATPEFDDQGQAPVGQPTTLEVSMERANATR